MTYEGSNQSFLGGMAPISAFHFELALIGICLTTLVGISLGRKSSNGGTKQTETNHFIDLTGGSVYNFETNIRIILSWSKKGRNPTSFISR
jgi:hypothetical protein